MNENYVLLQQTKADLLKRLCLGFNLIDRLVMGYNEEKSKLLKFLVDGGYLEKNLVENTIHEYLLELGCGMQITHLRTKIFPDHLGSDALFGYAIKHERVHPSNVTFDHGETAAEYIVASDGLLDDVLSQLLAYKKFEILTLETDSCCGSCC